MNKILNLVLTDRDIRLLKRCLHNLPVENTAIVCNTTDENYRLELAKSNLNEKYDIVYTESNGKPGKGHQSCLDIFLKTNYDYLIKIDGDDFLMPDSYEIIKSQISLYEGSFDVIGIQNEWMIMPDNYFTTFERLKKENPDEPWIRPGIQIPEQIKEMMRNIWKYDIYRNVVYSRKGANVIGFDEMLPCLVDSDFNRRLEEKQEQKSVQIKIVDCESLYVYDRKEGGHSLNRIWSQEGQEAYEKVFLREGINNEINKGLERITLDAFYTMDEIKQETNRLNELYGV